MFEMTSADATPAVDAGSLMAVASIIAAFGAAMLFFRIQREIQMGEVKQTVWAPWADWLLIAATLVCLLLVILPLLLGTSSRLPISAAASATVMVAGYVFAILAHYRIAIGHRRNGLRENPEPAERIIVIAIAFAAAAVFLVRISY